MDGTGLQFNRICVDIEDKRILWNVSGHASQGQVLVALGPSGKCWSPANWSSFLPVLEGILF